MTWLRIEDDMLDHPKWVRAIRLGGDGVVHLWLRMCTWCARRLTDGEIPADMVQEIRGPKSARARERTLNALSEAKLIARNSDGSITVVDYLDYNPSKSEVLSTRDRKAKHQRDSRDRRRVTGDTRAHVPGESPSSHPAPIHPDPSRSIPAPMREGARDADPPSVPGLRRVAGGGVSRTYTMPGEAPDTGYLDEATLAGVSREQAVATWKYYFGAGLPDRGVERLNKWLVTRAKERENSMTRTLRKGAAPEAFTADRIAHIERLRAEEAGE